jgi:protein-S-isoprenylcysteine O-methyltransferase Ste14
MQRPMKSSFVERGGLWVAGQAVLMLSVLGLSLVYRASSWHWYVWVAGAGLCVLGAGCGLAGFIALGANLTPFPKPRPQARLVRSGIYAWVRHPLYTSVILASLGWALIWHSWPAVLAAFCLALFFHAKARREEVWLRAQYPEYAEYTRDSNRFIPWIY